MTDKNVRALYFHNFSLILEKDIFFLFVFFFNFYHEITYHVCLFQSPCSVHTVWLPHLALSGTTQYMGHLKTWTVYPLYRIISAQLNVTLIHQNNTASKKTAREINWTVKMSQFKYMCFFQHHFLPFLINSGLLSALPLKFFTVLLKIFLNTNKTCYIKFAVYFSLKKKTLNNNKSTKVKWSD